MPFSYVLGEHFETFIQRQIARGRYASASEVVREASRLLEESAQNRTIALKALREEVAKGMESGPGRPANEVLDRLERRYAAMANAYKVVTVTKVKRAASANRKRP